MGYIIVMDWMFVFALQNSWFEALRSNIMVFGDVDLER